MPSQKRKKPEPKPRFKTGDRVKEAIKVREDISNPFRQNDDHLKRCAEIRSNDRKGTVTEVVIRKDSRGARHFFVKVLWDGFKSPSEHKQSRLAHLDDNVEHW